ncbi:sensor histidine kinase KdpD [uncultured Oscillibacter sp.]|uniref:sensor histidine kinase n=1 Tax=uncultured Oscillibacter sp. TaxID=876091 RepID=UPI00216F7E72|nr:HAMP domain-containing sensor histidine kinase [uncultured Oscillibacter sp.]MCI9012102.1 HAMP domain-containing histidine kinase [Oscillibacter sp.]
MLPALILALAALGSALLRLWAYRAQLLEMARVLEETPPESNLRLTVRTFGMAPRRLCWAVNQRLEEGRQLRLETQKREQELKYTMTCISHDIRTPLAGAMGYLQLLEEDPERQTEYLDIVRERLEKLEELLEELFLYTRLQGGSLPLKCETTAALPPLWDALAEFYPQLEAAGVEPKLRFDREDMTVWASPEALGRVYRNLIANALRHGGGGLTISGQDQTICFSNELPPGPKPDPERLFDRFYQSSPDRAAGGAGLGLSIVRELMERMGGQASAQIMGNELQISLRLSASEPPAK